MASVGCGMKRVQREGVRCGHEEQLFGAHEDVSAEQLDQRAVRRRQPGCVQQLRPQVGEAGRVAASRPTGRAESAQKEAWFDGTRAGGVKRRWSPDRVAVAVHRLGLRDADQHRRRAALRAAQRPPPQQQNGSHEGTSDLALNPLSADAMITTSL